VAEVTVQEQPVPIEMLGFPGFLPTGSVEWLFEEYGLTPEGILAAARRALARKASA
jgi:transketolase